MNTISTSCYPLAVAMRLARAFLSSENAVTAIEYGLIAALIAVGLVVLVSGAGGSLNLLYERIADCLATPTGPKCNP
jgi:pilus assembly protein Flp/PilA